MTKAQGRQSKKNDGKYTAQFQRTTANKLRRAKREKRLASDPENKIKAQARAFKRVERNHAKGIPRPNTPSRGSKYTPKWVAWKMGKPVE